MGILCVQKIAFSGDFLMTAVFLCDISEFNNLADYEPVMSDYRISKIKKMKNEKAKRLSAMCEIMLAGYLKRKPKYEIDGMGKPFGEDVFFSFSHSGDIALCAVSDKEIGADIEKIRDVNPDIAKRFCDSEYNYIKSSADSKDAFFEIWTKKESFLKAEGFGISGGLKSFCVLLKDGFFMYDKIPGYKVCVYSKDRPEFILYKI